MKTIIFFAVCYSILNLIKDLLKGFSDNPEDVYFDIFSVVITTIPLIIELVNFFKKDINHWKHFQIGVFEAILMSYFPRWIQKNLERGTHFYCNHCKIYPRNFTSYDFIYFSKNDKQEHFWRFWHSDWLNFKFIPDLEVNFILGVFEEFLGKKFFDLVSIESISFSDGDLKFIYKLSNGKIVVDETNLESTIGTNLMLTELKKCYLKSLPTLWFKIGDLQVIIENDRIRVKHILNNFDEGAIYTKPRDLDKLALFCDILQYWKLVEDCGVISSKSAELVKRYMDKPYNDMAKILHTINIQEILTNLDDPELKICRIEIDQGFRFRCEGEIVVCNHNQSLNIELEKPFLETIGESSSDRFDVVDSKAINIYYYYAILSKEVKKKFGELLGEFIVNYTEMFFKGENSKALLFILKRTSCWRYRDIGRNWESKRYLADMNYILEVAGLPRFTHIDKKVEPTRKIRMLRDKIPKTPIIINREIIDFEPLLKLPKKSEINHKVQSLKDLKKQHKNSISFLTLINQNPNKNIEKSYSKNSHPRIESRRSFFQENKKIVTETDDYKSLYPSLKLNEETSKQYENVLKTSMDFKKVLTKSLNYDVVKSTKEKITRRILNIKKSSSMYSLKKVNEVLTAEKNELGKLKNKNDEWFKSLGFKTQRNKLNVEQDLLLENRFAILNDYIESENEDLEELTVVENFYFLKTVGEVLIEKNFGVKKIKYILNSFKKSSKNDISKSLLEEIISHFLSSNLVYLDSQVIYQELSNSIIKHSNVYLTRPFKRLRRKKPVIQLSKKMMKQLEKKKGKEKYNKNPVKKEKLSLKRKNCCDIDIDNPSDCDFKRLKGEKKLNKKLKDKRDIIFKKKIREMKKKHEGLKSKSFCLDEDYLISETLRYFHSKNFMESDFAKYSPNPKTIKLWIKFKDVVQNDSSINLDFRFLPKLPKMDLIDSKNLAESAEFYKAFKKVCKFSHKNCYFLIYD